jgi:Sulfotransferase family
VFVSHRFKAIFVHIQRTGGNSIQRIFQRFDPDLIETAPVDPAALRTKHCYLSDLEAALDSRTFREYTKFAVVRNPFDRLLSWYHFFKDGGHHEDGGIRLAHESRLLRLAHRGQRLLAGHERLEQVYTKVWLGLYRALRPGGGEEVKLRFESIGERVMREVNRHAHSFEQFVMLPREHPGGVFERFHVNQLDYLLARDGQLGVDVVLRFETLSDDFADLAQALHFPGRLPHVNASSRGRDYRVCYEPHTRDVVAKRFHRDCERFGYEF